MWICPQCQNELGDYNGYCEYCLQSNNIKVYNPNPYYIREITIYHIGQEVNKLMEQQNSNESNLGEKELFESIESNQRMTPQEKKFAKLFYHGKLLVKDMDTLQLRAHIEELSDIAFTAKAHLHAAIDEDDRRRKTAKPKGFERSLNIDDAATTAIHTIQERQKKLSKKEQVQEQLKKLYEMAGSIDSAKLASQAVSAAKLSEVLNPGSAELRGPLNAPFTIVPKPETAIQSEAKKVFNPFAKKDE